jgi:hypothetical protein
MRALQLEEHSEHEDGALSFSPMYAERLGNQSLLQDGLGLLLSPAAWQRWYGAADRKGLACSAERAQQAGEGL